MTKFCLIENYGDILAANGYFMCYDENGRLIVRRYI